MGHTEKELEIITSKSRADKAINTLKGILTGIILDKIVSNSEMDELYLWANNHNALIKKNPFNEFMNIIKATKTQNIPFEETVEDLFWLCQKYEHDNIYYNPVTSDLQLLQGICHGILSDGVINEKEVLELNKWLEENEHLNSYYPYDEIRSVVFSIVADGIIEEEEIIVLKAYLNQFVNIENKNISNSIDFETSEITINGHCTIDPVIEFKSKVFCITGVLKSGTRTDLESKIIQLGGIISKGVIKSTDYLIVGNNGNQAWAFSCYGRKVEKAIQMRKKGHEINLIHEFDLLDIIEDNI